MDLELGVQPAGAENSAASDAATDAQPVVARRRPMGNKRLLPVDNAGAGPSGGCKEPLAKRRRDNDLPATHLDSDTSR